MIEFLKIALIILAVCDLFAIFHLLKPSSKTKLSSESSNNPPQLPPVVNINLPPNVALDSDGLPYKTNRVYGYGKQFNVFITHSGKYFHRSKCKYISSKQKILLHRYNALKKYPPCPYCNPISYIDNWYLEYKNFSTPKTKRMK